MGSGGGLRETLARLVDAAKAAQGEPVRKRLPKGLSVALKFDGDVLAVQLSRADVYPSNMEWRTVINLLPRNTLASGPKAIIQKSTYYLKGNVRLAPELL
jgi:hypothetical protein